MGPPQHEKNEKASQEEAEPVEPLPADAEAMLERALEEYLAELKAQETPQARLVKIYEDDVTRKGKPLPGPAGLRRFARESVRTWFSVDKDNEYPDVALSQYVVHAIVEQAYNGLLFSLRSLLYTKVLTELTCTLPSSSLLLRCEKRKGSTMQCTPYRAGQYPNIL